MSFKQFIWVLAGCLTLAWSLPLAGLWMIPQDEEGRIFTRPPGPAIASEITLLSSATTVSVQAEGCVIPETAASVIGETAIALRVPLLIGPKAGPSARVQVWAEAVAQPELRGRRITAHYTTRRINTEFVTVPLWPPGRWRAMVLFPSGVSCVGALTNCVNRLTVERLVVCEGRVTTEKE